MKKLPEWGYRLLKPILSPIFKLYYTPKIYNEELIPKSGPIIIVGNHLHLMDQCSVIISTKRVVHYLAKKEYFKGPFSWFFKITGCISVDRNRKDKDAVDSAIQVLESGGAVGLFPEGTRNKTDKILLPFKYGAVSLAKKTGATIIPFGIKGDYSFRSKSLTVTFGKPFKVTDMNLTYANKLLEKKIKNLIK